MNKKQVANKAVPNKGQEDSKVSSLDKSTKVNHRVKASVKKKPVTAHTKEGARKTHKTTTKREASAVTLPQNASQRMLRKVTALEGFLDEHLDNSVYKISIVSAWSFVLVGLSLITANYYSSTTIPSLATLFSSETFSSSTSSSTQNLDQELNKSEFRFLEQPPEYLTNSIKISLLSKNNHDFRIGIKSIRSDLETTYPLEVEKIDPDTFATTLPGQFLSPGYYVVVAEVKPLDGSSPYNVQSSTFFMGDEATEDVYLNPQPEKSTASDPTLSETTIDPTSTQVPEPSATEPSSDQNTPINSTSLITITNTSEQTSELNNPDILDEPINNNTQVFRILKPLTAEFTGVQLLRLETNQNIEYVELYALPTNSTKEQFVTQGFKQKEVWQFVFDTNDLPNNEYLLFARSKVGDNILNSNQITITVLNNPDRDSVYASTTSLNEEREILTFDQVPPIEQERTPTDTYADELLKENAEELNEILKLYAIAQQTGDEIILNEAENSFKEKQEEIINTTLTDTNPSPASAVELEAELETIINNAKEKTVAFEQARKERTGGRSNLDTDKDGIADVDEVTIYKTDPTNPDSDNDGFNDGLEISRGYNPKDNRPEAVITYDSPKDTSYLTRNDLLHVESIKPVITNNNKVNDVVTAEIKGKALPNSFVTLYIFSTPTVVTVKTDADGNFVYSFDKELEDGKHEIYVAVTDNAGEIVAQSDPFSFVKEAEAFTPVLATDVQDAQVLPSELSSKTSQGNYSLVVGLGVLSLGLILLLLGLSLRLKND